MGKVGWAQEAGSQCDTVCRGSGRQMGTKDAGCAGKLGAETVETGTGTLVVAYRCVGLIAGCVTAWGSGRRASCIHASFEAYWSETAVIILSALPVYLQRHVAPRLSAGFKIELLRFISRITGGPGRVWRGE